MYKVYFFGGVHPRIVRGAEPGTHGDHLGAYVAGTRHRKISPPTSGLIMRQWEPECDQDPSLVFPSDGAKEGVILLRASAGETWARSLEANRQF